MDLLVVSQLLGTVAIVLSGVMKFPQLMKIYASKSARGVSLSSLSLELFCYTIGSLYGIRLQYPLVTFGEMGLLTMQNLSLHILVIHFEKMMSTKVMVAAIAYMSFVAIALVGLLPFVALQFLFTLNLPIVILSKLAQIRALIAAGSAGEVSLITWVIASIGCFIRIFTTIVQTQDTFILVNYAVGGAFNVFIVFLILYLQQKERPKTS